MTSIEKAVEAFDAGDGAACRDHIVAAVMDRVRERRQVTDEDEAFARRLAREGADMGITAMLEDYATVSLAPEARARVRDRSVERIATKLERSAEVRR